MSDKEITDRFQKVFGREITSTERRSFFLDFPSWGREEIIDSYPGPH
jgi:hypothetical protein